LKRRTAGSTQVYFSPGVSRETGKLLRRHTDCQTVLLVHSSGSWLQPILEQVVANLEENGFNNIVFHKGISPNPHCAECDEGIRLARENDAGIIVALGAGSYVDAAKYIASEANADFYAAIPTTAGTASYFNEWAVLIDEQQGKKSMITRAPDIAILDPETLTSLPPHLSLYTGMDCFSHGLEAYFAKSCPPVAAREALQGCRLVVDNLEDVIENGKDVALRSKMFEADLLTGRAMMRAGLGILHCIANVISGFYPHYQHGFLCGLLIRDTVEYNRETLTKARLNKILPLVEQVTDLFNNHYNEKPPVVVTKNDLIIEEKELPGIVQLAVSNVNAATNPRPVTADIVEHIIRNNFYLE